MILQTKEEDIIGLMKELDQLLIKLLDDLTEDQWHLKTIAPQWSVKDIATLLLDGNLRALSMLRDGYFGESQPTMTSNSDLVQYLNKLNHDWVKATKRLSPAVLIDLLETTGKEYMSYLESLNPETMATFSLAWAGENESTNRFHIAREYTEKWHHQQQIRCAIGDGFFLLLDKWFRPYLEASLCALHFHWRRRKNMVSSIQRQLAICTKYTSGNNWSNPDSK